MKLHELHVGDAAAGAPGHGDAVAGGGVGIAGVEIHLRRPTGGEDDKARVEGRDPPGGLVQGVDAEHAVLPAPSELAAADQVNGDVVLVEADVRMRADPGLEGGLERPAGGVGGVDDAPVAVAALAREVIVVGAVVPRLAGERHAQVNEPADRLRPAPDHVLHRFPTAQAGAGADGVLDVGLERVLGVEYRGHAALGVEAGALGQRRLGEDRDAGVGGEAQGETQAGGAAADDQDVRGIVVGHRWCRAG